MFFPFPSPNKHRSIGPLKGRRHLILCAVPFNARTLLRSLLRRHLFTRPVSECQIFSFGRNFFPPQFLTTSFTFHSRHWLFRQSFCRLPIFFSLCGRPFPSPPLAAGAARPVFFVYDLLGVYERRMSCPGRRKPGQPFSPPILGLFCTPGRALSRLYFLSDQMT